MSVALVSLCAVIALYEKTQAMQKNNLITDFMMGIKLCSAKYRQGQKLFYYHFKLFFYAFLAFFSS
jgi:hypothetical protein